MMPVPLLKHFSELLEPEKMETPCKHVYAAGQFFGSLRGDSRGITQEPWGWPSKTRILPISTLHLLDQV